MLITIRASRVNAQVTKSFYDVVKYLQKKTYLRIYGVTFHIH